MMNELYVMNADKEKVEVDQLKTLILFVMKYFPNAAEFRQRIQNIVEGSEAIQVITTMCEILRERDKLLSKKINREQICKNYIESTKEFTNSTAQGFFKRHLSFANPPILYEFLKDNYFVFCKYPKLMVKTDIKTDKHLIGNIEKSLLRKVDPTKYIQYSEINNFFKTSYESTQKLEHNNIIPDIDSNHKGGKDIKRMEHNKTIINDNPFNYSPNTKNEEKIIVKTEQELWNDKNLEETRPISVAKRVLNSDISPSVSPSKANIKIPSAKVDKRMMDVTEKLVREQPVEEYKVIEQKNVPIGGRPVLYYPPVEEEEPDLPGEEEEPEPDIPDEEIYHISTPLFENHQKPSLPDYPKITIRYKTGEIIQSVSQTDAILTNNHITFGKDVKCNIRIKSEKVQNVQGEILYNGVDGKFYMKCLSENNLTLYKVQTDTRVKLRRNNYFTLGEQVAFSIGDLQEESPDPILSPNISDQLFDPRPMLAPTYSQHSQIRIIEDINGGSDITIVGSGKGNVEREYVFGVSAFADYQLIKREGISNKHFRIGYSRGFGWYILDGIPDKGSTNGTYLALQNYDTCIDNAQPFLLHGQMEFQIGDLALLVIIYILYYIILYYIIIYYNY